MNHSARGAASEGGRTLFNIYIDHIIITCYNLEFVVMHGRDIAHCLQLCAPACCWCLLARYSVSADSKHTNALGFTSCFIWHKAQTCTCAFKCMHMESNITIIYMHFHLNFTVGSRPNQCQWPKCGYNALTISQFCWFHHGGGWVLVKSQGKHGDCKV